MLFQYGTMAGIMEGAFSGSLSLEELLKHGNFGIGTFDGIDGEMIIVDGNVYKTDYYGNSSIQPGELTTPFASVTNFKIGYQKMHTRSPKKQEKPYPPLLTVLETQNIFNYENTTGVIIGFYSPTYAHGVAVGGLHLHYISDNLKNGGHVFDFEINDAQIEISKPLNYFLQLPRNSEYENLSINTKTLGDKIHKAEIKVD